MVNIDDVLSVLWVFESGPSAHCMVKSIAEGRVLTESEAEQIYEDSEGHNDSETENVVRSMSVAQLNELISLLKEINQEAADNYDIDTYIELTNGMDIEEMLATA